MEERRREVERRDALLLDQAQRLAGVPARLRDEAARRRGASRAASGCPSCGRAASRRACGRPSRSRAGAPATRRRRGRRGASAARPWAARSCRTCRAGARARARRGRARPGAPGRRGSVVAVADHDAGAAVVEAVVDSASASRQESGTKTAPAHCAGPVEERGLEPVVEHDGDAVARRRAPSPPAIRRTRGEQLAVASAPGRPRARGGARTRRAARSARFTRPAASRIASTIGS